jgi:superfamily I DNA/RNA helicase
MSMQFTAEQAGVIDSQAANVVVNAFAGTGKTTTLRGYALARPRSRILYLAFNKAMAQEAAGSFPENVDCRTMHSLAYTAIGYRYRHKLGTLRPHDLLRHYSDVSLLVADVLVKTLENFMYSASPAVTEENVPESLPMSDRLRIAGAAQQVWRDMIDEGKPLPLTHDAYLKLYQLSMPVLSKRYDIILLDEAQDTNPVTADVVFRQSCGKVLVGDRHQSIYGFRGNVNVMDMLPGAEVHYLTRSMRFGSLVANAATTLLRYMKAEAHTIIGGGAMAARPDRIDEARPYAIISRTNAGVFNQAVGLLGQRRVHFVGGLHNSLFGKLRDIYGLWSDQGELVQDAFYREFGNFDALASYGRETSDKEILSLVSVVNQYRAALPELMNKVAGQTCANAADAQVLLLTAHRSKGLQFDQVLLDDDYQELVDKRGRRTAVDEAEFEQEVNLLYVAMTRAKRAIQFNRQYLAFIEAIDKGTLRPLAQ